MCKITAKKLHLFLTVAITLIFLNLSLLTGIKKWVKLKILKFSLNLLFRFFLYGHTCLCTLSWLQVYTVLCFFPEVAIQNCSGKQVSGFSGKIYWRKFFDTEKGENFVTVFITLTLSVFFPINILVLSTSTKMYTVKQ